MWGGGNSCEVPRVLTSRGPVMARREMLRAPQVGLHLGRLPLDPIMAQLRKKCYSNAWRALLLFDSLPSSTVGGRDWGLMCRRGR